MQAEDTVVHFNIQRETLRILDEALGGVRDVAIIDAPNQRNVGDSLIWAGELAYLQKLNVRVRYVSDLWTYDASVLRKALPKGGVVLLHGGGNFGDIWPGHQALREAVISELIDYKIVQLPQSVYFRDPERAEAACALMSRHPDLLILLREKLSMQRAASELPSLRVRYCPDMAFGWELEGSSKVRRSGPSKILVIARKDAEAFSGLAGIRDGWLPDRDVIVTDWGTRGVRKFHWRVLHAASLITRKYIRARRRWPILPTGLPDLAAKWLLVQINALNIESAVNLYADARVIVVDRLHAHVLAALMAIPHVVLDNNYRKVSEVYEAYSGAFSTANFAGSVDDARVAVLEIDDQT